MEYLATRELIGSGSFRNLDGRRVSAIAKLQSFVAEFVGNHWLRTPKQVDSCAVSVAGLTFVVNNSCPLDGGTELIHAGDSSR